MEVTFSIRRLDPDVDQPASYFQDYELELEDSSTVLDGLIKIREEVDGTLALRCSCRSAICGSCAMRINGDAGLACNTKVIDAMPGNGAPRLTPNSAGRNGRRKTAVISRVWTQALPQVNLLFGATSPQKGDHRELDPHPF